jgi:histidinol-phosphate aminotransferase
MKSAEDFIVPWVKSSEPYSDKHMDIAWENPKIIRMMSNENLLAPSELVLDAIVEAARLGNLYPGSGPELRKKLGEAAGLTADHVVLGNGSTDVINFVIHTFIAPGEDAVISVPTFPMYAARVRVAGGNVISVPVKSDFYWDMDGIIKALTPRTKLIFICSPNNPTGTRSQRRTLSESSNWGSPHFLTKLIMNLRTRS